MKPSKIRVLIAEEDDQIRRAVADFLSADPLMEIADCRPARELAGACEADVAVLGLLADEMRNRENLNRLNGAGVKVIVIARDEADAARFRALASDVLIMPEGDAARRADDLYMRLKYQIRNARLARAVERSGFAGTWRVFPPDRPKSPVPVPAGAFRKSAIDLVAIGASAGGTQALLELIPALPADMPAVALVQHMPEAFVPLFAAHLRRKSAMRVCLAEGGERIEQGVVYLTALDRHLTVVSGDDGLYIACEAGEGGICPAVDRLFYAAAALGERAIGVILTGMGADGAKGLLAMRRAGAHTIGQDAGSCVVYGMPQAAYKLDAVERQLPLRLIPQALRMRAFPGERRARDAEP